MIAQGTEPKQGDPISRYYFYAFLAIAGYFLLAEHRAHVIAFLPYLLVLSCLLMHFFMHRGGHGDEDGDEDGNKGKGPHSH